MTYSQEHLEAEIAEAQAAIVKFTDYIKQDDEVIAEFLESSPITVQTYRNWKIFHQRKIEYFQERLKELLEKY